MSDEPLEVMLDYDRNMEDAELGGYARRLVDRALFECRRTGKRLGPSISVLAVFFEINNIPWPFTEEEEEELNRESKRR